MNIKKINKELDKMLEAELPTIYSKDQFIDDLKNDVKTMQTSLTSLNNKSIDIKDPLNMIKRLIANMVNNIKRFEE